MLLLPTKTLLPRSRPLIAFPFSFSSYGDHPDLHSFPTRRSSDLICQRFRRYLRAWRARAHSALSVRSRAQMGHACGLPRIRSEEHTSELQSHVNLVCRLLLEKKKAVDSPLTARYHRANPNP